ncbi:hypothetical protein AgCh_026206 [Apium graveolens]
MPSFASIPFKWEEASGKPRIIDAVATNARSSAVPNSQAVRCLVPPPMLMNIGTSKVTIMYKVVVKAVRDQHEALQDLSCCQEISISLKVLEAAIIK